LKRALTCAQRRAAAIIKSGFDWRAHTSSEADPSVLLSIVADLVATVGKLAETARP